MSMETKHGPGQGPHGAPNEGYEHSDANPRGLSKWAVTAGDCIGGGLPGDVVAI